MPAHEARPSARGTPGPPEHAPEADTGPEGSARPSLPSGADQVADKVKGILRSPR